MKLNNNQKAEVLDKIVTHAETIESGDWLEGKFQSPEMREKVEDAAKAFLAVYRAEIKKIE